MTDTDLDRISSLIHMHIHGTFATGQQQGLLIIWSPDPIGSFATGQCTGQPTEPSAPSLSSATPRSTER